MSSRAAVSSLHGKRVTDPAKRRSPAWPQNGDNQFHSSRSISVTHLAITCSRTRSENPPRLRVRPFGRRARCSLIGLTSSHDRGGRGHEHFHAGVRSSPLQHVARPEHGRQRGSASDCRAHLFQPPQTATARDKSTAAHSSPSPWRAAAVASAGSVPGTRCPGDRQTHQGALWTVATALQGSSPGRPRPAADRVPGCVTVALPDTPPGHAEPACRCGPGSAVYAAVTCGNAGVSPASASALQAALQTV